MMSETDNISGFLNETTEIEEAITNAKTNIERIQGFQGQILNSTSTTQEDATTRARAKLIADTRNLLVECKDRIRKIQTDNLRIPSTDPKFGIRQQRYEYLRTKLSSVLEEYRQAESNFMKQTKDRMARQYKVVNPNATQQEIDDYVSNSDSQPIFQQALLRTNEAKNALAEVKKRHEDIKNIENTIAELVSLFQELHLQVSEIQDQTIVNIVDNAETTAEKTGKTTEELGKANKLAVAARKKKWICFGITLLIIIIIVVVVLVKVVPNLSNKSDSPKPVTTAPSTPALSNGPNQGSSNPASNPNPSPGPNPNTNP